MSAINEPKVLQINFNFQNPEIRIEGADFTSCNGLHAVSEPAGLEPAFWFQIHRPEDLQKETVEHRQWLRKPHDFSILMNNPDKTLYPSGVDINLIRPELDALWTWPFPVSYASTFSWQFAVAIYAGYDLIDIRDVKLSDSREKWLEAPNMLLWAGEAHKRGIEVLLSEPYTHQFLYGCEERLSNIPGWAPKQVIADLFPGWSRTTRGYFEDWFKKRYAPEETHSG